MKIGIQRAEGSHGWSEDHGGHCLEGSAEDEASVVDDGGALEEDVDACRRWGSWRRFVRFELRTSLHNFRRKQEWKQQTEGKASEQAGAL